MSITFPASPSNGDTFTWGGTTYTYDATPGIWRGSASGSGGGGGGGGADLPLLTFSESATAFNTGVTGSYTIPYTGTYRILLVGAGGSGWVSNTGGSVGAGIGSGGGAGFAMIHAMALTAGDIIAYTLGARHQAFGQDVAGVAGGNSTLSINGTVTLTANGGGGGNIGVVGTGGTATGGDFRLAGADGASTNFGAAGGLGGLNRIDLAANTEDIATYLGNPLNGNRGDGGISTTNGSSQGNAASVAIQASGITN